MTKYKLIKDNILQTISVVLKDDSLYIPFAPDNTDYQNFKAQINADAAELQDADGQLMTPEQAKAFIETLP